MINLIKSIIRYFISIKDKNNKDLEEVSSYLLKEIINESNIKSKTEIDINKILIMLSELKGTSLVECLKIIKSVFLTEKISGDVCEFGVAQGKTTKMIAYLIRNTNKKLYIYDSFQGLPKPTKEDTMKDDIFKLGNINNYEGKMSHSEKKVIYELNQISFNMNNLVINKGFFNENNKHSFKFPKNISFAYIDFDFYQPTKDVLHSIENLLIQGSILIVDDYDYFSTGVKKAVDEWYNSRKEFFKISKIKTEKSSFVIIEKTKEI